MAKIFISHSSSDKIFVQKLAADLTEANLLVWFDQWELEPGDQIFKTVSSEINQSAYVILVLSPRSLNSRWVQREVELVLAKEQELGRVLLVPVMLETCEIPEQLKDRVYVFASENYRLFLDQLIRFFRLNGVQSTDGSDDRLLVLRPKRGYHLNQERIERALHERAPGLHRNWTSNELLVQDDEAFTSLRNNFFAACDGFESDPTTSPLMTDYIENTVSNLRRIESAIIPGLIGIFNNASTLDKMQASATFLRILRTDAIMKMNRLAGHYAIPLPYTLDWPPISNDISSAAFYSDDRHIKVDVYDAKNRAAHFSIFANPNARDLEHLSHGLQVSVNECRGSEFFSRYLLPQMAAKHFYYNAGSSPLEWDFNNWRIGLG
jgi:hypothetical protein